LDIFLYDGGHHNVAFPILLKSIQCENVPSEQCLLHLAVMASEIATHILKYYHGWSKQQEPSNPTSSCRSLKDSMNIQPTVNAFIIVEDSDASPSSLGPTLGSTVKADTKRTTIQMVHRTPARTIGNMSLVIPKLILPAREAARLVVIRSHSFAKQIFSCMNRAALCLRLATNDDM